MNTRGRVLIYVKKICKQKNRENSGQVQSTIDERRKKWERATSVHDGVKSGEGQRANPGPKMVERREKRDQSSSNDFHPVEPGYRAVCPVTRFHMVCPHRFVELRYSE